MVWERFKLKFSPEKVDTMVIQSIALLDDLDKEINIYAMRVKVRYQTLNDAMAHNIVNLGVVRMAFPRTDEDPHRQSGVCSSCKGNG
jgi:hypothetical protein